MAKDFFEVIAAKAGFAGEYEALSESEFAASPGDPYSPPETGVFRVVASRTIQFLADSPVYFQTFQTSDATIRMPSGAVSTNDANDGRFYIIRNSSTATGRLSIETSEGSSLVTINPRDTVFTFHGENDDWEATESISATGGPNFIMVLGGALDVPTLPLENAGIEISNTDTVLNTFQALRGVPGTSDTTTVQLEINGSPVSGTSLSWTSSDGAFSLKTASIDELVSIGDRLSIRLTSAEAGAEDIFSQVS